MFSNFKAAIAILKRATVLPPQRSHYFDESAKVQHRVYRSLKLWSLYADLEESMGTFESCKAVYERILDLRIATPQVVINYTKFLEDNNYFEESFKVALLRIQTKIEYLSKMLIKRAFMYSNHFWKIWFYIMYKKFWF